MEPDENNIHVVEIFLLSLNRVNQEVYIWGFIVFVFGLFFLNTLSTRVGVMLQHVLSTRILITTYLYNITFDCHH